jgi:transcriptional regulator with XRE-family HTH domain
VRENKYNTIIYTCQDNEVILLRSVGEILKVARLKAGYTQKEIAKYFGISERTYQYYESSEREPTIEILIEAANFFNVSIDYLVGRSFTQKRSVFSERIRELREKREVTQKQIASEIDVTERQWHKYELGEKTPEFDSLIALADYFGVSLDYLVGRSDDPDLHKKQRNQLD